MADKIEPALTSEEWRKPSLDIIAEQITDQYGHIEWLPASIRALRIVVLAMPERD